jgi:competence CoiA-like predicted nuclease
MKECLIKIDLGLAVRELIDALPRTRREGELGFLCPGCHEPVKPFAGGVQGPHFEHIKDNPMCKFTDV